MFQFVEGHRGINMGTMNQACTKQKHLTEGDECFPQRSSVICVAGSALCSYDNVPLQTEIGYQGEGRVRVVGRRTLSDTCSVNVCQRVRSSVHISCTPVQSKSG